MTNLSKKYAKYDTEPGLVPEQDGHFCVNYLPIKEGWETHVVKAPPKLDKDQWVEVIHRNGETDRGPVDCFAWRLFKCRANVRQEYFEWREWGRDVAGHDPKYDHLDMEITHYRAIPTPPDWWVQGMAWPFKAGAERESA